MKQAEINEIKEFLSSRQVLGGIGIGMITVGVSVTIWLYMGQVSSTSVAKNTKTTSTNSSKLPAGKPDYPTAAPKGKDIDKLGGWRRVSPKDQDPVYAFLDTIDNIKISVSQQPLPKSFEGNVTDKVAEIATSYNATTKLVGGDTTFYIGTSVKGPQSVILTKNNALILIKSEAKINDSAWKKYVESLN